MTTALARTDISEIQQVARLLAMSNYFDAKGNGEQAIAQLATKILAGQEMGYGPFASVQGIHVIQGKPVMSANLMAAAVKASTRYDFRAKITDDAVSIEFFERINGKLESLGTSVFTKEDAKAAGTQNMAKYGRNMMYARAMSNGVKWYCPDVFYGNAVYTPDELGAAVDSDGNYIEVTYTASEVAPESPAPSVQNGDGKPAKSPSVIAQQAFHAQGVSVFGKQWDEARPWLLKRYTAKNTPDNVREHTSDMSIAELNDVRISMVNFADRVRELFAAHMAEAPAIDKPLTIDMATVDERDPDGVFA